jgi:hypothetical protein
MMNCDELFRVLDYIVDGSANKSEQSLALEPLEATFAHISCFSRLHSSQDSELNNALPLVQRLNE